MQDDFNDVVIVFVKQGIVDFKCVCMVGVFYGGYVVECVVQCDGLLFCCVIFYVGVFDLSVMLCYDVKFLMVGVCSDWMCKQVLDLSVVLLINYFEQFVIFLFVVYGVKDCVVLVRQLWQFVVKLCKVGKLVEYFEQLFVDYYFSCVEDC